MRPCRSVPAGDPGRNKRAIKSFLITDYPQPWTYGTKQEHMAVSVGLGDGAQQGSVSKGPQ
jgi:hypothetical protein